MENKNNNKTLNKKQSPLEIPLDTKIILEITAQDTAVILSSLSKQSYEQVANIIGKLQLQINGQLIKI